MAFDPTSIATLEVGGSNFKVLDEGSYEFEVDSAEWGQSKKGVPMLTVTFVGTDDKSSGATFTDRVVITYPNRKTGKDVIHWNIPMYAHVAGGEKLFPADAKKRAAVLKDFEKWQDAVAKGLIGKKAVLDLEVQEGTPYLDPKTGDEKQGYASNSVARNGYHWADTGNTKSASSVVI